MANLENLIARGYEALEDESWEEAQHCFEKVLDEDFKNSEANIGRLLTKVKAHNLDALCRALQQRDFSEDKSVARAIGYLEDEEFRRKAQFALYRRVSAKKSCIDDTSDEGDGSYLQMKWVENGRESEYTKDYNPVAIPFFTVPDGVKELYGGKSKKRMGGDLDGVFENCGDYLIEIFIPYGAECLEMMCFRNSPKLECIWIPETVTDINENAFWECENLKKIIVYSKDSGDSQALADKCSEMTISAYCIGALGAAAWLYERMPQIPVEFRTLEQDDERLRPLGAAEEELPVGKETKSDPPVEAQDVVSHEESIVEDFSVEKKETDRRFAETMAQMKAAESQVSVGNTSMVKCPRCYSYMEAVGDRTGGFSGKKAALGGALFGAAGLFAGALGKKKISYRCPKCGYTTEK